MNPSLMEEVGDVFERFRIEQVEDEHVGVGIPQTVGLRRQEMTMWTRVTDRVPLSLAGRQGFATSPLIQMHIRY